GGGRGGQCVRERGSRRGGPAREDRAQYEHEEPDPTGGGEEAAEAHHAETDLFAEGADMLLAGVGFSTEAVGSADGESEREDRLPDAKADELPAGGAPAFRVDKRDGGGGQRGCGRGVSREDFNQEVSRGHERGGDAAERGVVVRG